MKWHGVLQTAQLEMFARFLEEHPGFAPELVGEDALICGFRMGDCFLTIGEMERLFATKPHFDEHEAALLLAAPPQTSSRRRS